MSSPQSSLLRVQYIFQVYNIWNGQTMANTHAKRSLVFMNEHCEHFYVLDWNGKQCYAGHRILRYEKCYYKAQLSHVLLLSWKRSWTSPKRVRTPHSPPAKRNFHVTPPMLSHTVTSTTFSSFIFSLPYWQRRRRLNLADWTRAEEYRIYFSVDCVRRV